MCGIPTVGDLRARRWESLYLVGLGYRRRGQDLQYDGERPGPGWVAHGYFCRWLWVLASTGPRRVRLYKRRWRDKASGGTTHSRPPDELGRLSVCSLTFALLVFGWLSAVGGAAQHQASAPGLEQVRSRRTLQRWVRRAAPQAMESQQAIRLAIIERSEPRPMERLFPAGVSPPEQLVGRPWRDPLAAGILWGGLALFFTAAVRLAVAAPILLAEARRRSATPEKPLWI